jgi:phosphopantetheine adenylyltransferase
MDSQRGLTLGKFAPFHKGHQFLIETALSQMDEVIVIIYEAREATSVPINIRVGWILPKYLEVLDKDWDEASANWVRMRW